MKYYQFPCQKLLCDQKPFSRKLLHNLLETACSDSPPFTGYLKIAGDEPSLLFLFFFNGSPYASGRFADNKPVSFSIQEFGEHLAKLSEDSMTVNLCATDPVLLKCMLLFLQEEPAVKAPTSLIDIDHIVRQIGETGSNAMITLCRDKKFNFFFFREGIGALAHYADQAFKRPEGMTVDEEMLLYAFQPGETVQAYIFYDMVTNMAEDSNLLNKDSLDILFSTGYPKNRRRGDAGTSPTPAGIPKNRRRSDAGSAQLPAAEGPMASPGEPQHPRYILTIVSGPLQGERFTVTLPCVIGRKGCDLILDDHRISRRHAEITLVDNIPVITDLASTNGTRVNNETITSKQLVPTDVISIGPTTLRISPA